MTSTRIACIHTFTGMHSNMQSRVVTQVMQAASNALTDRVSISDNHSPAGDTVDSVAARQHETNSIRRVFLAYWTFESGWPFAQQHEP